VFGGFGAGAVSGSLISNLTLSDQTSVKTCAGDLGPPPPPCGHPDATLLKPFPGTAQPAEPLNVLNGGNAKGRYTFTAFDCCGPGFGDEGTVTITGWSIKVKPVTPPQ
jgi:hypothetical protein